MGFFNWFYVTVPDSIHILQCTRSLLCRGRYYFSDEFFLILYKRARSEEWFWSSFHGIAYVEFSFPEHIVLKNLWYTYGNSGRYFRSLDLSFERERVGQSLMAHYKVLLLITNQSLNSIAKVPNISCLYIVVVEGEAERVGCEGPIVMHTSVRTYMPLKRTKHFDCVLVRNLVAGGRPTHRH